MRLHDAVGYFTYIKLVGINNQMGTLLVPGCALLQKGGDDLLRIGTGQKRAGFLARNPLENRIETHAQPHHKAQRGQQTAVFFARHYTSSGSNHRGRSLAAVFNQLTQQARLAIAKIIFAEIAENIVLIGSLLK